MAQGNNQRPPPPKFEVVVRDHPKIKALSTPSVYELLDQYLIGNRLTGVLLVTDLMSACTVNPRLLKCTDASLFNVLVAAARNGCSIGENGIWPVIRELEVDGQGSGSERALTAMPQRSYKLKMKKAKDTGAFEIVTDVICKGEKFTPIKDGGLLVGVEHDVDYLALRLVDKETVLAAWGVIAFPDGRRHYRILTKNEINQAEASSAAKKSTQVPWKQHYGAMVKKTVLHRILDEFVVDYTTSGGGVMPAIEGSEGKATDAIDVPFEVMDEDIATDLDSRGEQEPAGVDLAPDIKAQNEAPTEVKTSVQVIEAGFAQCQTVADHDAYIQTDLFLATWGMATIAEKDIIKEMGGSVYAELQKKAEAGSPQPASGEGPAPIANPDTSATPEGGAQETAGPNLPGEAPPPPEGTPPKPPVFPRLPDNILPYERDPTHADTGLRVVIREHREAWKVLPQNPAAIENLYFNSEAEWQGRMGEVERALFATMREKVVKALKDAKFPCEI